MRRSGFGHYELPSPAGNVRLIREFYGRSLGVQGGDGSRSTIAVFDYKGRLYQIEAKALPGGTDSAGLFNALCLRPR